MKQRKIRQQLAIIMVFLLSVGGAALHARESSAPQGGRDWASALPDGEGKGLVLATCTGCHNLSSTVGQRKSAARWTHTVQDMVARGAQLEPQEIAMVANYLARNFGPDTPLSGADQVKQSPAPANARSSEWFNSPAALPEDAGKALVLRACVECHALDRITRQSKDESGWRASVKDMVRLGAKLRPEEETVMVAYLTKHFSHPAASAQTRPGALRQGEVSPATQSSDPAQMLPDGEGKGLVLASCVQCHNLRTTVVQRKDAAGWRHTVHDMIARGAQVTWPEAEIIARYLAEHLSKGKP
jgi:competence protein ComEA